MFFKKSLMAGLAFFGLAATTATAALSEDDFVEATWMTTRFFGAQRSGIGPNWMADGTNYPTSFTKDSYQGMDISGGWFDCGDHVMFGQTQGFASYVLALAYAEFTEGYYDLYTGDYTDYKASKDYSRKGGKPNKIRDLLEELRYEADFWVKVAPDENTFIAVKGNGDYDHMKWVTPGKMSTLGTGNGGDPRPVQANTNDAYSSGMAAAMLAVMARVDPDEANRAKYLKGAKNAYAYSKAHKGVTTSGSYYVESWWDGRWKDGPFLAALELYRTTKTESYKSEAESYFEQLEFNKGGYSRLNYANAVPLSVVVGESIGLDVFMGSNGAVSDSKSFLDKIYKNESKNDIFMKETGGAGSFSVRTPSGGAFLYALYSKYNGTTEYDALIEKNIAYLLGDNSNSKSYVVGFDRNGAKAPTAPHHRGYYANEDEGRDPDSGLRAPEKNKYFGAMIAGSFNDPGHNNTVSSWNVNEVCVDMNAPLVGALGYILSKKAPKSDAELGVQSSPLVQNPDKQDPPKDTTTVDPGNQPGENAIVASSLAAKSFRLVNSNGVVSVASANSVPFKVQVFDLNGNMIQSLESNGREVFFLPKAKGVLQVRVSSQGAKMTYAIKSL